MIYWKRQMYALPSLLSKEKGTDKPERLWIGWKVKKIPGSNSLKKDLFLCWMHYISPDTYDIFQECTSIKRQASINNSWQGPYFLLDWNIFYLELNRDHLGTPKLKFILPLMVSAVYQSSYNITWVFFSLKISNTFLDNIFFLLSPNIDEATYRGKIIVEWLSPI